MTDRKRDWEVITGWEKRIKVDYGSIGPNHVRWSDWTYKERDIVARKVHEITGIQEAHGPRSKRAEDWAKENAPIMTDFARDGKMMPPWAHAEYRQSGVPEYVQVAWKREDPNNPASHGDWAYDPPGPWSTPGPEPAWSARPMDAGFVPAFTTAPKSSPEGYNVNELEWRGSTLVLPVTDIVYPADKDELLGMVKSQDSTRPGWVTMSPLEALGSGLSSTRTETVRNATELAFKVSQSYSIEKHPEAEFKLYFRKSNGGRQKPEYTSYTMPIPERPDEVFGLQTKGNLDPKFGGQVSYRTAANGDHIATDGTVISTAESRAQEDVPQWRKFELGRLEIVDNVVIPGPNALEKDQRQYGENVKLTNRYKVQQRQSDATHFPMGDPDRIMPDDPNFTALEKALSWAKETRHGPQHQARWSKVAAALGADNGYPPMSLHEAEGLWERFNRNKRWSMAVNAIEEMEGDDIAAANRYRNAVGLPPVERSQSDKLRDALVDVNLRPDVEVREFNPETQSLDQIAPRRQPAGEGNRKEAIRQLSDYEVKVQQERGIWMDQTYVEGVGWCIEENGEIIGRSPDMMQVGVPVRQPDGNVMFKDPAPEAVDAGLVQGEPDYEEQKRKEEMDFYHNGPPMQGHFSFDEWKLMYGEDPEVVEIPRWHRFAIIDPALGVPNYWLEGPSDNPPSGQWARVGGEWKKIGKEPPPRVAEAEIKGLSKELAFQNDVSAIEAMLNNFLKSLGLR